MQLLTATTDREAWLRARRTCITATDIGALLGLNPWRSPSDIYLEKLGQAPELEDNISMYIGREMESAVAKAYADFRDRKVEPAGFVRHPDVQYFGATPDFWDVTDEDKDGGPSVLEIKVAGPTTAREFGDEGTDEVPPQYLAQVLWQMYVSGAPRGILAVLINNRELRVYNIARDEALIQHMAHVGHKFWNEYVSNEMPPPLTGLKSDTERVREMFPAEDPESVTVADFDTDELCKQLEAATKTLREAEVEVDRLSNLIKVEMGEYARMDTTIGTFRWTTPKGARTNYKLILEGIRTILTPEQISKLDTLTGIQQTPYERRFGTPFRTGRA